MRPKEIYEDTVHRLAEEFPSNDTEKKWAAEFEQSRNCIEDDSWLGHLKTSTTDEQVDVIQCMDLNDRHITTQQIANPTGISSVIVYTVYTEIEGGASCLQDGSQGCWQQNTSWLGLTFSGYFWLASRLTSWVHHFKTESKI